MVVFQVVLGTIHYLLGHAKWLLTINSTLENQIS